MLVILISVAIGFLLASFSDYKKFNKKNKNISSLVKQVEVLTEKIKNIEQEKIAQEPKKIKHEKNYYIICITIYSIY